MTIILYDLAGAEPNRRFSPFCWRARMALAHKGLAVETVPWGFTEKEKLPQPNAGRVPVIVDGGTVVHDSTSIADYLEEHYADRPTLFGGATGRALARFVQNWTETVLRPGIIPFVVLDIHRHSRPQTRTIRRSREERLGKTLEEVVRTARRDCRRFAPASTHCAAPSSGRISFGQSAGLCRLHRVWRVPMGACDQRF